MKHSVQDLQKVLSSLTDIEKSKKAARFFKTAPGDYSHGDQFRGIPVPVLRKIAKQYENLNLVALKKLIKSIFNEDRLLALIILVNQFKRSEDLQDKGYDFYINNLKYINNWNLVDASAHWIVGAYVFDQNVSKNILIDFSQSANIWERRIAIVATWYFIRNNDYKWTLKIAVLLLQDDHDLIHKAVGWMLREVGKRDISILEVFLNKHAANMPRTMLRYAIEKMTDKKRRLYLDK